MRTTLTLDDDVEVRLREEMHRRGISFKRTVNELLRKSLTQPPPVPPARFKVRARDMGLRPGINLDDIRGLLDEIDGPDRR